MNDIRYYAGYMIAVSIVGQRRKDEVRREFYLAVTPVERTEGEGTRYIRRDCSLGRNIDLVG